MSVELMVFGFQLPAAGLNLLDDFGFISKSGIAVTSHLRWLPPFGAYGTTFATV